MKVDTRISILLQFVGSVYCSKFRLVLSVTDCRWLSSALLAWLDDFDKLAQHLENHFDLCRSAAATALAVLECILINITP